VYSFSRSGGGDDLSPARIGWLIPALVTLLGARVGARERDNG